MRNINGAQAQANSQDSNGNTRTQIYLCDDLTSFIT